MKPAYAIIEVHTNNLDMHEEVKVTNSGRASFVIEVEAKARNWMTHGAAFYPIGSTTYVVVPPKEISQILVNFFDEEDDTVDVTVE